MGYPPEEVTIAFERCGPDALIDELSDFICAAPMASAVDPYYVDPPKPKASSSSGPSSTLFRHFVGAGFPESLVSKAIEENGDGNMDAIQNALLLRTKRFALKETRLMSTSSSVLVAEAVWKNIEATHSVTDQQLEILHYLFGKNFERATRIVDQQGVRRISGESSGRSVFQVVGESRRKEEYLCFAEQYCGCYSFFYDVVNRGEQLCCKHQLAARLASTLGICMEVKISEEELSILLSKL